MSEPTAATYRGHHLVHVHRGRKNHLRFGPYHTLCGQIFDGIVTGPPTSERPVCSECESRVEEQTA